MPNNWEDLCLDMAMRMAYVIVHFDILASLVLNADQTGVVYISMGSKTWAEKGTKQVQIIGKDEKQQFTLMPTLTAAGKALPSQAIFSGKTFQSLPSAESRKASEAHEFLYTCGGDKHWSNLDCMQEV